MHVDLNACFAMTEQQANPLLRGRPVAVTNRGGNDRATIIAASYEAKLSGIGCGTRLTDAKLKNPKIKILESDPAKYLHVHNTIKQIFNYYCPEVTMKSIDEGVLDFRNTVLPTKHQNLSDLGLTIKNHVKEELGEWMTVNIGIGSNRFLAKLAASLNKPNGLEIIDPQNFQGVYATLRLTDLPGINRRYKTRLNLTGISTVNDFFLASESLLASTVFKSIHGRHWHYRLHGYEVDDFKTSVSQIGKQYVLPNRTTDKIILIKEIDRLGYFLIKKLHKHDVSFEKLYLTLKSEGGKLYKSSITIGHPSNFLFDLQKAARKMLQQMKIESRISIIYLTTTGITQHSDSQQPLFETILQNDSRIESTMRLLNEKYGDFSLVPANLLVRSGGDEEKIAFGSVRYF